MPRRKAQDIINVTLQIKGNFIDIKEVDGMKLIGMCVRCGQCCAMRKCEHLVFETFNNRSEARCAIYPNRPGMCVLYPMPNDELPESCGYKFVKKE